MNRSAKYLVAVTVGLIAITAIILNRLQASQTIGLPGVRVIAQNVYDENGDLAATNAVFLPERIGTLESTNAPITRMELDWLPKDTTFARRLYRSPDGFEAMMSVVLMGTDRTSIHKPQQCLVGQGIAIDSQDSLTIPIDGPPRYELPVLRITGSLQQTLPDGAKVVQRAIYVYWFVAEGALTSDHNDRMLRMAKHLLTRGELQRWAYVSCLTFCAPGHEEAAYSRVREMLQMAVPQFQLTAGDSKTLARLP